MKYRLFACFDDSPLWGEGEPERTPAEFRKMADAAGLRVTFEAFPRISDGVMELRRA
jgi:hypothetical protein